MMMMMMRMRMRMMILMMINYWIPHHPQPIPRYGSVREEKIQLSNEQGAPGFLGFIGDEKLPSYVGIVS